jgi:hypothetical protein
MASVRINIRDAIYTALTTPTIVVDSKNLLVYKDRFESVPEAVLRANHVAFLKVYDEDVTVENLNGPFYNISEVGIDVELAAQKSQGVDDSIDAVQMQIQHRIAAARLAAAVGGARYVKYAGRRVVEDEENLEMLRYNLRFSASYVAAENQQDVAL